MAFVCFVVPVSDIKSVVTGKDCPHMKEKSALKQNKVSVSQVKVSPILLWDWNTVHLAPNLFENAPQILHSGQNCIG